MEDHEIQYQKGYEIAFLQVHFKTLLNSSEKDLIFEMNITKQCFENAVKQGDFSQEFIDKFNYEKDNVLI
jgi:hypothetical protein